ncbi:MAG: hypothetical protein WBG46_15220 [Nonlabens sp.]
MLIRICLVGCFAFCFFQSKACLNADQHKIFPIGVVDGKILVLKAHLHRTHSDLKSENEWTVNPMWIITSTLNIYDRNQNLKSESFFKESTVHKEEYAVELSIIFDTALENIDSRFPEIEYFKPTYISFCDFQKKCNRLEFISKEDSDDQTFVYAGQQFNLNTTYFDELTKPMTNSSSLSNYYISSVRIFKSQKFELVLAHVANGHEVSMGFIGGSSDSVHVENKYISEENRPDVSFENLGLSIYQEPLMHHGFGYDFFFIREN